MGDDLMVVLAGSPDVVARLQWVLEKADPRLYLAACETSHTHDGQFVSASWLIGDVERFAVPRRGRGRPPKKR